MHHFEYVDGVLHAEGVPVPLIAKESEPLATSIPRPHWSAITRFSPKPSVM